MKKFENSKNSKKKGKRKLNIKKILELDIAATRVTIISRVADAPVLFVKMFYRKLLYILYRLNRKEIVPKWQRGQMSKHHRVLPVLYSMYENLTIKFGSKFNPNYFKIILKLF